MESEFNVPEAISIEVRMLSDNFTSIFVQPTQTFCTSWNKSFLKKK